MKVRVHVQLEEDQYQQLKRLALQEHVSLSEVLRRIVSEHLGPSHSDSRRKRAALNIIGMVSGDPPDVAEHHDDYLAGLRT